MSSVFLGKIYLKLDEHLDSVNHYQYHIFGQIRCWNFTTKQHNLKNILIVSFFLFSCGYTHIIMSVSLIQPPLSKGQICRLICSHSRRHDEWRRVCVDMDISQSLYWSLSSDIKATEEKTLLTIAIYCCQRRWKVHVRLQVPAGQTQLTFWHLI